jgi:hypothetical protein
MSFFRATPSIQQVRTSENYVSSVDFLNEIHKPDVADVFVKRYGDQALTGFIEMLGAKKEVSQKSFMHFEEDWIHQTLTVKNTTLHTDNLITGGFVLEVTEAEDAGTTQSELDYTFIRPNNIIQFENGRVALVVWVANNGEAAQAVEGYTQQSVSDVSSTANKCYIEVLMYDGVTTDASALAEIVSKKAIITGLEFGEGTDQPDGLTPNVIKYENQVMIIKEAYRVTGSEATNATYMKVEDAATGKSGYLWYLKGESDTFQRFNDYAEMQMLVGETVADGAAGLTSLGIRGTEGLIDFAEGGNDVGYTTSFGVDDFRAVTIAIDKNRGAMENTMWCGLTFSLDVDDAFRDYFDAAGASFGTFEGSSEKAVSMGFKSFTYGGYTFHKKTYKAFNYSQMLGYTTAAGGDSVYRTAALLVPADTQIDPVSRETVPSLAVRYKAAEGYSREMEHWLEGSAVLSNKTNGKDELKANYRTERGFEGFAPNRYAWITKN